MKEITINGRNYYYKMFWVFDYDSDYKYTKFYTKSIVKKKKYCFFGELVDKEVYKECFTLMYNIESPIIKYCNSSSFPYVTKLQGRELDYYNSITNIKQNI